MPRGAGLLMMTPAEGVVVGNRYVLVRPLAKGGMGSVWIARHRELDVDVTVKFMMPTLVESVELRARFEREAKVAARLRSQHVVQVLDFGIDDGMPYIAMELLQGESLADRLKREPRLPMPLTAQIVVQSCKALRTAHEAGLVHRDLKPGNIFLAVKDGEEVVKILDFGIVKDTAKNDADEAAGATETGVMMGSVHYMSPEQIRSSRQVDHRSDLWSIAVIAYKMITGNAPFPGTNTGDVMVKVCTDSCPPPSYLVPGLPPAIDAFFVRALTREPAGRFQSAQEMADTFQAAASVSVPVSTGATQQPQKWVKTLPLIGSGAQLRASIEAAGAPPRPPQLSASSEPSYVSAVQESAAGTFQAVTMQPSQLAASPGTAIAAPKPPSSVPKGVVVGVALAIVILGLVVGILLLQKESPSDESAQAAPPAPSAPSSLVVPAPNSAIAMTPMTSSAPTATPPSTAASTTSPIQTAKTASPGTTAPKSAPAPRRNPLDIND